MDSTPVTVRLLGRYFMIDGDELERSYKHHLNDYSEWEQRDHASNWMLIEDNTGENLSIDETMLQEDLVTILSNKDGHCKQGSVIGISALLAILIKKGRKFDPSDPLTVFNWMD